MDQDLLGDHHRENVRNQDFFNQVYYSEDMNHNIMDALHQMLMDIQRTQSPRSLNVIVIAVSDGYDLSGHEITELKDKIFSLRNVRIIIGQYQIQDVYAHALESQARLQAALPGYVKIVKDLQYEYLQNYCSLYDNDQVNIIFGMSNLASMQKHIHKVHTLYGQLKSKYCVKKLYLINGQCQNINQYENYIPIQDVNLKRRVKRKKSGFITNSFKAICFIVHTIIFPESNI